MKKLMFLLLLVFTVFIAFSQIEEKGNVILGVGQQDFKTYNQGRFQYFYVDFQPIKSYDKTFSSGLFIQGANSNSIIDSSYIDNSQNVTFGATFGFMPKYMFFNSDVYFSFNLGYGAGWNNGLSSRGDVFKQKENFIFLSAYHHYFTEYREFLFRYKFYTSYSRHLKSDASLVLSNNLDEIIIDDSIKWKRNNLALKLDLDLARVYLGATGNLSLSPKVIFGYYNDFNHKNPIKEIGFGIDLFTTYYLNIVDLYISRKFQNNEFPVFTEIGASINISNLLREINYR
ncbi:hypothetical protein EOL94_02810 [bacterium]|nr:hypothetical protein [bacterium]